MNQGLHTVGAARGKVAAQIAGASSGTAFPATPIDGVFHRTDLEEAFVYSRTRALWMSTTRDVYEGDSPALVASAYFFMPGGLIFTSANGYKVPYACVLTEMHVFKNDTTNDPTFQVRVGGSSVATLQAGAGNKHGASTSLNVAVASGSVLGFYCDVGLGALLGGARIRAVLRRMAS